MQYFVKIRLFLPLCLHSIISNSEFDSIYRCILKAFLWSHNLYYHLDVSNRFIAIHKCGPEQEMNSYKKRISTYPAGRQDIRHETSIHDYKHTKPIVD